jgi:hypothetical protein
MDGYPAPVFIQVPFALREAQILVLSPLFRQEFFLPE